MSVRGAGTAQSPYGQEPIRVPARRTLILGIIFLVLGFVCTILPTFMFNHTEVLYTPAVFFDTVSQNLGALLQVFTGNPNLHETRLMQSVICLVSGAALGICASTYQGCFNNPLAAPKTLGIMSGGALGALVYILFLQQLQPQMPSMGSSYDLKTLVAWRQSLSIPEVIVLDYGQCICSIIGCFAIVGVVLLITSFIGRGKLSNITVIIAGQVFSVAITAIIQFARYYFSMSGDEDLSTQLAQIENYSMVSNYYYQDLLIVVLPILACIVIVLINRNKFTLLSFGTDEAQSMGVNVNRMRYGMIVVCTLMVGFAISFCGHVAFLGFISAHISRKIVGSDFRYLLPASGFVGGSLLIIIDWICHSGLPLTNEYAAASVCSVVGACIFLVLAVREGRRGADAWSK